MDYAFHYIKDNKGVDTEESYPYKAVVRKCGVRIENNLSNNKNKFVTLPHRINQDGTCNYKKSDKGATVIGFTDLPSGDESALKEACATIGPISIAIDASHESFQMYSGGELFVLVLF